MRVEFVTEYFGGCLLTLTTLLLSSDFHLFCICFCSFPEGSLMLLGGDIKHPCTLQCSLCQETQPGQWQIPPALPAKAASGFLQKSQAGRDHRGFLVPPPSSSKAIPEHGAQDVSRNFWNIPREETPRPLCSLFRA